MYSLRHYRDLICLLFGIALLGCNSLASAQVYKSYDAEGNVVFSDKPGSSGQEVEISEPNVSESFEAPPPDPTPPPDIPAPSAPRAMEPPPSRLGPIDEDFDWVPVYRSHTRS